MPPYCRLLRVALLLLALPQRERVLDAAGQLGHHALHLRDLVRRQREERLVGEDLPRELLAGAVRAALQLALHVLADHAAEGLQAQLEIVADAGELAGVEALGLQGLHDLLDVALDGRPVELVRDAPAEVAHLQEVHEPLEAGSLGAAANGHLHLAALAAHEELGQLVQVHVLLVQHLVELVLHLGILGAERLLQPFAERFEVEEVEVEDAVERGLVARFLHERRRERGLERLTVFETELGGGRERVKGFGRRDPKLGAPQVADELEDPFFHWVGAP